MRALPGNVQGAGGGLRGHCVDQGGTVHSFAEWCCPAAIGAVRAMGQSRLRAPAGELTLRAAYD